MKRSAQINAGGARTGFVTPQTPQKMNLSCVTQQITLRGLGFETPQVTPQISHETPQIAHRTPQTNLERLVNHVLEHGVQFGDGVRLVLDVPVRTSVGTIIPGVFDRFNFDTFAGLVWVHSNQARTTYQATELDAARWLYMLEVNEWASRKGVI